MLYPKKVNYETFIITQARVGSSRLQKKILKKVNDISLLKIHLDRIKKSKNISKLVIATTNENESEKIVKIGEDAVNLIVDPKKCFKKVLIFLLLKSLIG